MAMGNPLGPLFANIFLSHYESIWLSESPVKPILYRRYVDDTLWFLPTDANIQLLMNYMNTRHKNMRFTYETELDDCISFIGLTIKHETINNLHCYLTSVYKKPTSTALFTNFNSFTALAYRLSVFRCLVYRAYKLCSNWNLFHNEVNMIRSTLMRNAYPSWFLDRIIKTCVNNFINHNVKFGPQKERLYIGLPFLGKTTDSIRRVIKQINKQYMPNKDIIVFFKSGKRISNFFRIKDRTSFEMRSHVVYEYKCTSCHSSYIGETIRHLRQRVAEHKGVSHLTGRPVKTLVHSKIRDHCVQCEGSDCSLENFKILATSSSEFELLIKERLLIESRKPALNGNVGSFELLLT